VEEKPYSWKAVCTWGEGPDVLLFKERNGESFEWYDLTSKEAKALAYDLLNAAKYAEDMDESVEDYFDREDGDV